MDKGGKYSVSETARGRWNLLDLIGAVGRKAVPTYIFSEVDATWAEELQRNYEQAGRQISFNAILLKAIGVAQREHPLSRTVALPWGRTALLNDIVAGFTIERYIDEGTNPSVFLGSIESPDHKSIEDITRELNNMAEADIDSVPQFERQSDFLELPHYVRRLMLWSGLRDPEFRLHYINATFTLTSISKYGCKLLVPPSVCTSTFGVGSIEERAVVKEGRIVARPIFCLTLNFDHHVIDGAPAARFLKDICDLLEGGLENHLEPELQSLSRPSTSTN